MTVTPDAAIDAAAEVINELLPGEAAPRALAVAILKAGEPAIRASQRERDAQLAERCDAAYRVTHSGADCPYNPQQQNPHLHPFAERLREQS